MGKKYNPTNNKNTNNNILQKTEEDESSLNKLTEEELILLLAKRPYDEHKHKDIIDSKDSTNSISTFSIEGDDTRLHNTPSSSKDNNNSNNTNNIDNNNNEEEYIGESGKNIISTFFKSALKTEKNPMGLKQLLVDILSSTVFKSFLLSV